MMKMRFRKEDAFTLIELMVVLLILAMLATVIVPRVVDKAEKARRQKALSDISAMELLLDHFYLDMGRYPSEEEGLRVLYFAPEEDDEKWAGPYSKKPISKDPWDHPYYYWCPGAHTTEAYEIASFGKDGEEGGEGDDADIVSWVVLEDEGY